MPGAAISRNDIIESFRRFMGNSGGIDSWITPETPEVVFTRIGEINSKPLSRAQFNQLLLLSHEAGMSWGFFRYYWLERPKGHPYDVTKVDYHKTPWIAPLVEHVPEAKPHEYVVSFDQLMWGFSRFYTDALLFFLATFVLLTGSFGQNASMI